MSKELQQLQALRAYTTANLHDFAAARQLILGLNRVGLAEEAREELSLLMQRDDSAATRYLQAVMHAFFHWTEEEEAASISEWHSRVEALLGDEGFHVDIDEILALGMPHASLIYQDTNSKRSQTLFAELLTNAMGLAVEQDKENGSKKAEVMVEKRHLDQPVHIMVLGSFFYDHSVMDFYESWIRAIPSQYKRSLVLVGQKKKDHLTEKIMESMDQTFDCEDYASALALCQSQKPDVMIYPELGLNISVFCLGMQRLAPLQVAWAGHPVSSGLSNIDVYVSSRLWELEDAESRYAEALLLLDDLPMQYSRPEIPQSLQEESVLQALLSGFLDSALEATKAVLHSLLGESEEQRPTVYFCPMMLVKLGPAFDGVVQAILQRDDRAVMMFVDSSPGMSALFLRRLAGRLADSEMARVLLIPPQSRDRYYKLLSEVDIVLESSLYGAGNTALHALSFSVPVLSLAGQEQRSRFTAGYYQLLGMESLIVSDWASYVDLAIKLGTDRVFYDDVRQLLSEKVGMLFEREEGKNAFFSWLEERLNSAGTE